MGQLRQFEHERSASPIAVAWSQAKPHQKYEMYRKIRVVIRWRKLRIGKAVLSRLIFCGVWRWR